MLDIIKVEIYRLFGLYETAWLPINRELLSGEIPLTWTFTQMCNLPGAYKKASPELANSIIVKRVYGWFDEHRVDKRV